MPQANKRAPRKRVKKTATTVSSTTPGHASDASNVTHASSANASNVTNAASARASFLLSIDPAILNSSHAPAQPAVVAGALPPSTNPSALSAAPATFTSPANFSAAPPSNVPQYHTSTSDMPGSLTFPPSTAPLLSYVGAPFLLDTGLDYPVRPSAISRVAVLRPKSHKSKKNSTKKRKRSKGKDSSKKKRRRSKDTRSKISRRRRGQLVRSKGRMIRLRNVQDALQRWKPYYLRKREWTRTCPSCRWDDETLT